MERGYVWTWRIIADDPAREVWGCELKASEKGGKRCEQHDFGCLETDRRLGADIRQQEGAG